MAQDNNPSDQDPDNQPDQDARSAQDSADADAIDITGRPAEDSARQNFTNAAQPADDEADAAPKKAAAPVAEEKPKAKTGDDDDDKKRLASAAAIPAAQPFSFSHETGKRIECGNGCVMYDNGTHFRIVGKLKPEHVQMVMQLAGPGTDRNWVTLAAFQTLGRGLHRESTQLMASMGMPCVRDPNTAGTFSSWTKNALTVCENNQRKEHQYQTMSEQYGAMKEQYDTLMQRLQSKEKDPTPA